MNIVNRIHPIQGGLRPCLTFILLAGLGLGALSGCRSNEGDLSGTAGMPVPMSVGGTVRQGAAGEQDGDVGGVAGAHVELWQDQDGNGSCEIPVASVEADVQGAYLFHDLQEGNYCVGASMNTAQPVAGDSLSAPFAIDPGSGQGQLHDIDL